MGYTTLLARCLNCGRWFCSNLYLVPSCNNEPICKQCVDHVNPIRIANGLGPIVYDSGAYEVQEV